MNTVLFLAAVIFGFMLAELRVSRRNERALFARGARRPDGDVYGWMAILYPAAFLAMTAEGAWRAHAASTAGGPSWLASGVVLFVASKALKYWAIRSLGDRWSFRVLVVPGEPLVRSGPYRYADHPNYVAVIGELAGTAMMMRAWVSGPIMLAAFAVVLGARIRFETRVLRTRSDV